VNWLDVVLVAFIGFITWSGWRTGFIREVVSFAATVLAIPIAGVFYKQMTPKVNPIVDNLDLARMISFAAILIGVIVAGQVAGHLLKRTVSLLNLGVVDRAAGAGFGFLKAVIICQVALVALVVFQKPDLSDSINGSLVAGKLIDTTPAILTVLPSAFDNGVQAFQKAYDTINSLPIPTPTPAPH